MRNWAVCITVLGIVVVPQSGQTDAIDFFPPWLVGSAALNLPPRAPQGEGVGDDAPQNPGVPAHRPGFEVRFARHLGQKFADRGIVFSDQHLRIKQGLGLLPSFGHDGEVDIPRFDGRRFRIGGPQGKAPALAQVLNAHRLFVNLQQLAIVGVAASFQARFPVILVGLGQAPVRFGGGVLGRFLATVWVLRSCHGLCQVAWAHWNSTVNTLKVNNLTQPDTTRDNREDYNNLWKSAISQLSLSLPTA